MEHKGQEFTTDSSIEWEELGGGLKRKVMSYNDHLMMVKVAFEKGGIGTLHSHFHTQMSYVDSGVFEITIGEKSQVMKKGDTFYIPPYIIHGAVCMEAGILIDIFIPMREDFVS